MLGLSMVARSLVSTPRCRAFLSREDSPCGSCFGGRRRERHCRALDHAPFVAAYSGEPDNHQLRICRAAARSSATNYIHNKAKPDGLTALFATGTPIKQIIELPGIEFDIY